MKEGKFFLDTNIIVYAFDTSAKEKHHKAATILEELWNTGLGIISTQVLQEFFITVTKKIPKPLSTKIARDIVADFLKWEVVVNDGDLILAAIALMEKHRFSFWDSMIIASAIDGGANILLSEDLQHGQKIEGVAIQNPFK